jgi:outer membrane protein
MKKILTFSLLLIAFNSVQASKIGYLDIDYIVANSKQYLQAQKEIDAEFLPKEKNLLKLANEIKNKLAQLKLDKSTLTQKEMKQSIFKISSLEEKLKQKAQKIQAKLTQKRQATFTKIQDTLNPIIVKIAEEQDFDIILYQKVAYVNKKIDITDLINKMLNSSPYDTK